MIAQPEPHRELMWAGHTLQRETILSSDPATLSGLLQENNQKYNRCMNKGFYYSEELEAA